MENAYLKAILIIIAFFLGSYVVTFIMNLMGKATSKSKTALDDEIIEAIKLPVRYLAILLGFFFALKEFAWSWTIRGKDFGVADLFFIFIVEKPLA